MLSPELGAASARGNAKRTGAAQFSALIESSKASYASLEGETIVADLEVRNQGRRDWNSRGLNPCFLSYHLLDGEMRTLKFDNRRFPFPRIVRPGESVSMTVEVKAPLDEGNYVIEFDLLLEGLSWFKDYGSATLRVPLVVKKDIWPEAGTPSSSIDEKSTTFECGARDLAALFKLIRITLKHNRLSFRGKTGEVDGFAAGSGYSQIWVRDANTIIPASRYFYGEAYLRSWLEELLLCQNPDGSLVDWFDSRGAVDKNTTETDQETSAVQSAYKISKLIGVDWLTRTLGGVRIIDRLESALIYVLKSRWSPKFGLVTGAHTADWGDVDMAYPDQRAIYIDKSTHLTVDIYDQSMFFEAAEEIAGLWEKLGRNDRSSFWLKRAREVQKNANRWLWQEANGFYRVHLHLDSLHHDFDEDQIFALGGNVQAALSGLADAAKVRSIIRTALARQKELHISTISGTLLPPYPKGIFRHPALSEPYTYQNGGQWDWFGGKLITVMFKAGFSRQAREKLGEIARKDVANGGLFEWDTREGTGQGSDFYSGSAGSLCGALFEGYLGVDLSKDSLVLEPRLDRDEARVRASLPAANVFATYSYRFDGQANVLRFDYASDIPSPGEIRILDPWRHGSGDLPGQLNARLEIRKDGKAVAFERVRIGDDDYLVLKTDFLNHSLVVGYFRPTE